MPGHNESLNHLVDHVTAEPKATTEPIAIIGMSCRFPGADSPQALWKLFCEGVDAIREVPADRWNVDSFHDTRPGRPGKMVTRWGGFVDQKLGTFDAAFFGMSPREAAHLDPMQAWLMEVSWEAMEDAGILPEQLAGTSTGVFVGMFTEDAKISYLRGSNRDLIGSHTGTGTSMTLAANRLSYWFDLRGPSVALDTACSSSLVAVHLACRSLSAGESTLAFAGGVNAMFQPEFSIAESRAGMLSPDGRCKTWDARANGYVRGEGAGMVVLKRLSDAQRDGDVIHAIIRATGVNQDGRTPGITVPNGAAQAALAKETLVRAGVRATDIGYVEAHGTGTPVGDPIEARALGEVFGQGRHEHDRCLIGSLKTNIGHLEAAAGVAGLIKAVLVLQHKLVPPHLHLQQVNSDIDFDALGLRVARKLEPLAQSSGPAFAAVNSFGFGGTNAHAILEEAPPLPAEARLPGHAHGRPTLITLSARSSESLRRLASEHHAAAERQHHQPEQAIDLAMLATATALRRTHHAHRLALVAASHGELAAGLRAYLDDQMQPGLAAGRVSTRGAVEIAFVYTGMGPQWWGMGRKLLASEPVFRAALERCDAILQPWSGWSLQEELLRDEANSRMHETQISQPANFVIQVALTELLRSWGIQASAIVGHSAGEAAAFWAAGVYSLEQACLVIHTRSRLQHRTSGQGKLYALGLPYDQALAAIEGHVGVSIAAINSPSAVTLAGDPMALDRVVVPLIERGIFVKPLRIDVPFHSHYMDPLRAELLESLAALTPARAQVPLYSTVQGARVAGLELDGEYWWLNVRDPVYFAAAVYQMLEDGSRMFLEIGPHPVLGNSILECADKRGVTVRSLPTLRRDVEADVSVLAAVGTLYTLGVDPRWPTLMPKLLPAQPIVLPSYPWDRQANWEESAEARADRLDGAVHPLLGRRQVTPQPVWLAQVDRGAPAYLAGHAISGTVVFPGAGYVELGLQAMRLATGRTSGPVELCDMRFDAALFLRDEPSDLRTEVDTETLAFSIFSRPGVTHTQWERHAMGNMRSCLPRPAQQPAWSTLQARFATAEVLEPSAIYDRLSALGFEYRDAFAGVRQVLRQGDEMLAYIELAPEHSAAALGYEIPLPLLDGCFQALLTAALPNGAPDDVLLPISIERIAIYQPLVGALQVHGRLRRAEERMMVGDLAIYASDGTLLMALEGLRVKALAAASPTQGLRHLFHTLAWQELAWPQQQAIDDGHGTWLVLTDVGGVGDELVRQIEACGGTALRVIRGQAFGAATSGRVFTVDPRNASDFRELLAALNRSGERPNRIVHLWGLDAPASANLRSHALLEAQHDGVIALLHLGQSLEAAKWPRPPALWTVTRGACRVGDDQHAVAVAQTPLAGFAAAFFQQEHPELAGGIVDLDPVRTADEVATLRKLLLNPPGDVQLALRRGTCCGQRLQPAAELAEGSMPARMRADGTYLITGGRGGLGLVFARWLVARGARRLVLAGRTALPARTAWHDVDPASSAGQQIAAVRQLEAMGASIHVAAFDVANEGALREFLTAFRREGWPALRGVIHAAGVVRPTRFAELDAAQFFATLDAKLAGTWNLYTVLADEPLDFFVSCSSANVLGFSTGVVDYAAANAFLDGVAHLGKHDHRRVLSINWGAWGEVGMASNAGVARDFALRGILPIPPEQGVAALERSLEHNLSQVVVLAADWHRLLGNFSTDKVPPLVLPIVQALAAQGSHRGSDANQVEDVSATLANLASDDERRARLADFLRHSVSRSLRLPVERIDNHMRLADLGLDSIIAVELRHHITGGLRVSPTLMELLQGGSVASLTEALLPRIPRLAAAAQPSEPIVDELALELGDMSQDEVDALLGEINLAVVHAPIAETVGGM